MLKNNHVVRLVSLQNVNGDFDYGRSAAILHFATIRALVSSSERLSCISTSLMSLSQA
jgi:hypothetical protein